MQKIDDTEDGEISEEVTNEYVEPYQALERPTSFVPTTHPAKDTHQYSDESSTSLESSSDSSDEDQHPAKKRRKVSAKNRGVRPQRSHGAKRNVWSSVIFEDHIEKELKDVNVRVGQTLMDKSRDVESYYNYGQKFGERLGGQVLSDEEESQKIQETLIQLDKKDGADSFQPAEEAPSKADDFELSLQETQQLLKSRKRKMDQREDQGTKNKPSSTRKRVLRVEDLDVTSASSPLEVSQDIGLKLHEEKLDLISRAVEIIGVEAAINLFKETQEIENEGGIYVADGSRRRTPGGVFFYLLRNHDEIPMEQIRQVFSEEAKAKERHKRQLRAKRRSQQAQKLKETLTNSGTLPILPSRAELELQRHGEAHQMDASAEDGELADPDDNVVDIHFDCD